MYISAHWYYVAWQLLQLRQPPIITRVVASSSLSSPPKPVVRPLLPLPSLELKPHSAVSAVRAAVPFAAAIEFLFASVSCFSVLSWKFAVHRYETVFPSLLSPVKPFRRENGGPKRETGWWRDDYYDGCSATDRVRNTTTTAAAATAGTTARERRRRWAHGR